MPSFQTPTLPVITLHTVTLHSPPQEMTPEEVSLKTRENSTLSSGESVWNIFCVESEWRRTGDHTARPRRTLACDYDHREPRHNTANTWFVQT